MGVDYTLLIKTEKPLAEVKSCVENILNCQLAEVPDPYGGIYSTKLLGLNIALHEQEYEGEFILDSFHYNYEILADYLTPSFYGNYKGEWEPAFLIIIADLLYKNLSCECIVERNSGTILAKFPLDEVKDE